MKKTVVAIINAMYPGSKLLDLPQFLLSSQYYEQLKVRYFRLEPWPSFTALLFGI